MTKRKHEEDSATPLKKQKAPAHQNTSQYGFFDFPREVRDKVYESCREDVPFAHDGSRAGLASNSWTIQYIDGPATSPPSNIRKVCRKLKEEFDDSMFENMRVIVYLSIKEDDIVTGAPWQPSVPGWILENIRCVTLVLNLGHGGAGTDRFTTSDVYDCVQDQVDYATSLPALQALDVLVTYTGLATLGLLESDVKTSNLDLEQLLSTRPVSTEIEYVRVGLLLETDFKMYPLNGDYFHWWGKFSDAKEQMKADLESQDHARWHATLPTREQSSGTSSAIEKARSKTSKHDDQSTYLGLDWKFVARIRDPFGPDDDDGSVRTADFSNEDDGDSDSGSNDNEDDDGDIEDILTYNYNRGMEEYALRGSLVSRDRFEEFLREGEMEPSWATRDDDEDTRVVRKILMRWEFTQRMTG